MSNLGWRSLEKRRCDVRLAMFYKIIYGLVVKPVPPYLERLEIYTRHIHPLAYIQIPTNVCYYHFSSFLMTVVLWNKFPADLVLNPDINSFKLGISNINQAQP